MMTPSEMFGILEDPRIPEYLDAAGARVQAEAEANWPSESHPENVWATGTSVGMFSRQTEAERVVITNEAEYSGYTDDGFTGKGRRTARPWYERGGAPYLEQTAATVVEQEVGALLRHLTREG